MCKGPVVGGNMAVVLDEGLTEVQGDGERLVHEEMERTWGQTPQGLQDHVKDLGLPPQSTSYPSKDLRMGTGAEGG